MNYGYAIAFTTYGTIGVKVWIYRGMYGERKVAGDRRPPRRPDAPRPPLTRRNCCTADFIESANLKSFETK